MFRDAQEELKRLEAQLLAEEPEKKEEEQSPEPEEMLTEEDLDQIRQLLKDPEPVYEIRNFANQYGAAEEVPEEAPEEKAPRQLSSAWIIALAALVLLAVVGAVAWWLFRAGGLG